MKIIELTDEQYEYIEENIGLIDDSSYAYRIAEIISEAIKHE